MRLAVTIESENLDQLVSRVYVFDKTGTASTQAARKALVDVNPYLGKLDEVPPGTVFAVPDVEGAKPSAETQEAGETIGGVVVGQLRGAVALAAQQLSADIEAEIADARQVSKLAGSAELRTLRRESEVLKEDLPKLTQAASSRTSSAQELQRYSKRAFAQLQRDLENLVSAFRTYPPQG
jgi:hypothetical protein